MKIIIEYQNNIRFNVIKKISFKQIKIKIKYKKIFFTYLIIIFSY